MSTLDEITAIIGADPSGFMAAMEEIHRATEKTTESMAESFKSLGEQMDVAITLPLEELGREAVKEFNEATRNSTLFAVSIKATGDAVGWTADQLDTMAENLQAISGISKQDIMRDVTLSLLKFQDVQGDVFKRAQQDILDYSTFTGRSLSSASQQIGRALDNPINSLSRLERTGVHFTDSQKAMIKSLAEAGEKGKAQAIILDALEKSTAGAAAAMRNTPWGKITADITEFKEALVPVGGIVETALVPLFNVVGNLSRAFMQLSPTMKEFIVGGLAILAGLGPLITAIGFLWTDVLKLKEVFGLVKDAVAFLNTAFVEVIVPIMPLLAAFALLVVAGQLVYDNWNVIKAEATGTWSWIKSIIQSAVAGILESLQKIPGMGKAFQDTIKKMRADSAENMGQVHKDFSTLVTSTGSFTDSFNNMGKEIGSLVGPIGAKIKKLFGDMRQEMKDTGKSSKDTALEIAPPWVAAFNKIGDLGETVMKALNTAVTNFVTTSVHNLMTWSGDWRKLFADTLSSILDAIIAWGVQAMMVALNVAHAMAALFANPFLAIVVIGGLIALTAALSSPPKMAKGGVFDSPTTVTVGEAGPEVILPVTRLANGKMGVGVSGGGGGSATPMSTGSDSGGASGGSGDSGRPIQIKVRDRIVAEYFLRLQKDGLIPKFEIKRT